VRADLQGGEELADGRRRRRERLPGRLVAAQVDVELAVGEAVGDPVTYLMAAIVRAADGIGRSTSGSSSDFTGPPDCS
jgi:hypothetical protein